MDTSPRLGGKGEAGGEVVVVGSSSRRSSSSSAGEQENVGAGAREEANARLWMLVMLVFSSTGFASV